MIARSSGTERAAATETISCPPHPDLVSVGVDGSVHGPYCYGYDGILTCAWPEQHVESVVELSAHVARHSGPTPRSFGAVWSSQTNLTITSQTAALPPLVDRLVAALVAVAGRTADQGSSTGRATAVGSIGLGRRYRFTVLAAAALLLMSTIGTVSASFSQELSGGMNIDVAFPSITPTITPTPTSTPTSTPTPTPTPT
ncbi:MAG: hypothetical protein ACHRXM_38625, partial [Isosphaerales bacterium]